MNRKQINRGSTHDVTAHGSFVDIILNKYHNTSPPPRVHQSSGKKLFLRVSLHQILCCIESHLGCVAVGFHVINITKDVTMNHVVCCVTLVPDRQDMAAM